MRTRRLRNFVRGVLALATLVALLAGLPLALYKLGGSPIPDRLPSGHEIVFTLLHRDNGSLFIGAVRDVSWLAWLMFTVAVLAEIQAALRRRRAPRLHLIGMQAIAGKLVAAIALTFTTPAVLALVTTSAMAATTHTVAPVAKPGLVARADPADGSQVHERVVIVRPGDCLWTIAAHYLGAGDRFDEIVRLNLGHAMGDGRVFSDPSVIMVGWHLELPGAVGTGSGAGHSGQSHSGHGHSGGTGQHGSGQHGYGEHGSGQHGSGQHGATQHGAAAHGTTAFHPGAHDGHASDDARFSSPHHAAGSSGAGTMAQPGPADAGGTQAAGPQVQPGAAAAAHDRDQVAEVALFAFGMLAGGALASVDRLRHRQRQNRRPGRRIALPADPAERRIEQKLRSAARLPLAGPALAFAAAPVDTALLDDRADSDLAGSDRAGSDRARSDRAGSNGAGSSRADSRYQEDAAFWGEDDSAYEAELDDSAYRPDPNDRAYFDDRAWLADEPRPAQAEPALAEPALAGPALAGPALAGSGLAGPAQAGPVEGPDEVSVRPNPASVRDALLDLSEGVAVSGEPLPPIVGIHLTPDTLDVLLSAPAGMAPPEPFVIAPGRQAMCWTVPLGGGADRDATVPPAPGEVGDLLPGLFTAGATEAGGFLLLDLEAMRVTCCDGPDELTDRMLVTAATELVASDWRGWYDLVLVGCDELDVLGRAELCANLDDAIGLLDARSQAIARRLGGDPNTDVRTCRMADPADEDWGLTLLVSRLRPTPEQMARLLELAAGPGGIAALVAGDVQTQDGQLAPALFELAAEVDHPDRIVATITLAYLGPENQITVWPQTLTIPEYEALAGVFATAADPADVAADDPPYSDFGAPPWIRLAAAPVAPADLDLVDDDFARPVSGPEAADSSGNDQPGQFGFESPPAAHRRPDQDPARAEAAQARPRPTGSLPRHAAPSLSVKVLGPVQITGAAEPLLPKQAELVLALALHAPGGVSNSGLCSLLGPDADHPRPADSVRQLITRTRKRLGKAPDGQEYIIHLGSGIYVPHGDLSLDWASFSALVRRGRAERRPEDLRAALTLVQGEPFADCYHWWIDVALIETIRAEIVDTAELLAQIDLASGDPHGAARAARTGLVAETAAEQLWRALMRAEHEAGNPDGVLAAWTGCLDAIAEIAPSGEPHPETEQLFHQLTRGAPIGTRA